MEDQILHERECYITSAASGRSVFTWEGVLHYFSCKWKINFDMRGSVTVLQLLLQVEDPLWHERQCYITSAFATSGRSTLTWEAVLQYFSFCYKWKIHFDMRGSVTVLQLLLQVEDPLWHERQCYSTSAFATSGRSTFRQEGSKETDTERKGVLTSLLFDVTQYLKEKGRKLRAGIKKERENCDKTFN